MSLSNIRYVMISPVRNEEKNIEKTIISVLSQTIRPIHWVIVDDGSTDRTPAIIRKYIIGNPWIRLLTLEDRGYYDLMGGGEIKAFYRGFATVTGVNFDFIVKLDGDISFDECYFEKLFEKFSQNPKLGIASGACYYETERGLILEHTYQNHVRGAARAYRTACWEAIGGVIDNLGWDAIDVYKARMLGWETRSFEPIVMIHHVKTWTKGGLLKGRMRSGRMEYLMGSHPLFFGMKVLREFFRQPYIVSCIALLWGYLKTLFNGEHRVVDDTLMCYIRKEQLARLMHQSHAQKGAQKDV